MNRNPLPNLLVIGAAKCATHSLHQALGSHPDIFMSEQKELNYFLKPEPFSKQESARRDIDWYRGQFAAGASLTIQGESSPAYSLESQSTHSARKIAATIPDVKIIYSVRDPFERISSHYLQWLYVGPVPPQLPLDRILRSSDAESSLESFLFQNLVYSSCYFRQISQYFEHFSRRQIKIVFLEDLSRDPVRFYQELFRFLEVDDTVSTEEVFRIYGASYARRRIRGYRFLRAVAKIAVPRMRKPIVPPRFRKSVLELLSVRNDGDRLASISNGSRDRVARILLPDIDRFEELTHRDLTRWRESLSREA